VSLDFGAFARFRHLRNKSLDFGAFEPFGLIGKLGSPAIIDLKMGFVQAKLLLRKGVSPAHELFPLFLDL